MIIATDSYNKKEMAVYPDEVSEIWVRAVPMNEHSEWNFFKIIDNKKIQLKRISKKILYQLEKLSDKKLNLCNICKFKCKAYKKQVIELCEHFDSELEKNELIFLIFNKLQNTNIVGL
jgi:hypothetical protein